MTTYQSHNILLHCRVLACAVFILVLGLSTPGCADNPDGLPSLPVRMGTFPEDSNAGEPASGLVGWLGTYNTTLKMHNASIFTTIFGAAFVAFFIAICWGKLVELYGALGGLIGGG
ncbi:MAG: hypothetical protein FWD31_06365, partial [Planctomycetaceae bacterium]|nr:hypothetical protein [Planctomycetaceae bacterium]